MVSETKSDGRQRVSFSGANVLNLTRLDYLNRRLIKIRLLIVSIGKRDCEIHFSLIPDKIVVHQIARDVRTAVVIPLPKYTGCRINDKLAGVNPASLRIPDSQRLLLIEVQNEAIAFHF